MARCSNHINHTPDSSHAPARLLANVVGERYVALMDQHLRRLRGLYDHPNRTLHYDTVLAALLMGFHNGAVRSLRTLEDQSRGEGFNQDFAVERICRSTLSDCLAQMDGRQLLPIIGALTQRLPGLARQDQDLAALLKRIIAADGSVFTVPADVLWAIALRRSNGRRGRQIRLNLQLDVLRFLPSDLSVSGAGDGSESAAFIRNLAPGVIYVCDRNFVDFAFIHAVLDKASDIVVRLKRDTRFIGIKQNPITESDRIDHNLISDRIGHVPGSSGSPGFGDRLLREVILLDPRSAKPVRLLTNLLEVPARTIGQIYRHRWMIELFFKWLKCVARVRHLFSQNPNGIAIEFYVAVIAVLLNYLRSGGRRPSVYAFNCLGFVAAGQMSVARMLQVLADRERERELERARLARKRSNLAAEKTAK